jgi:hypothetical protein
MGLFSGFMKSRQERAASMYSDLIRKEAKIGGEIFGPVAKGGRREFFCLNKHTWVWHEEWVDPVTKKRHVVTTRYDIRPNGILKAQDGQQYRALSMEEMRNFYDAVKIYEQRVVQQTYLPALQAA